MDGRKELPPLRNLQGIAQWVPRPPSEVSPVRDAGYEFGTSSAVAKACLPCRISHVKCSGGRPCQNCERRGMADQCLDVPSRRGVRAREQLLRDQEALRPPAIPRPPVSLSNAPHPSALLSMPISYEALPPRPASSMGMRPLGPPRPSTPLSYGGGKLPPISPPHQPPRPSTPSSLPFYGGRLPPPSRAPTPGASRPSASRMPAASVELAYHQQMERDRQVNAAFAASQARWGSGRF